MPILKIRKYVIKCGNHANMLKRLYYRVIYFICENQKDSYDLLHQLTEHRNQKKFCQMECSQLTCYQWSMPLVSDTR